MKKTGFQKIVTCLFACILLFGLAIPSYAANDDFTEGKPEIFISGNSVYEVQNGEETRIDLQVKNKGSAIANRIVMRAKSDEALPPFKISFSDGENVGSLGVNSSQNVRMYITMDETPEKSSYPITISYTYQNAAGDSFSGSEIIHLKIKGFDKEPTYLFDNMKMVPESLTPGQGGTVSGIVKNSGSQDMLQAEVILDKLQTEGISLSGGFSSMQIGNLGVGKQASFSFPLSASADMAAGNYPVTIKLKYQDEFGKEYEKTQDYYISVGGENGKATQLEIRNMKEPQGVYDVNQNFQVTFDLCNTGQTTAKDIVIKAEGLEATAVVPKSTSMKNIASLPAGKSVPLTFTFAGTNQASTQNYAVQFTVTYKTGNTKEETFKQYAGVNIKNSEKEKKEEEENDKDKPTSKPKIIVSKYVCDPLIVMAGEEFDLKTTLMNTHPTKGVKNIKMFLTLAEETSSESEKSGNIFTPVNSSNTYYFDAIAPKSTVDKELRLYVVPNAQPKTYTLTVNFEYEDETGKEYTATELLGINVKQITELSMDEIALPESVEQYAPVTVSFSYYNTGKVALNNVMFKIEGDVDSSTKSTYIGNMEPGASDYYEATFTSNELGEVPVSIVASYEDTSGETIEERRDFVLNVTEPMPVDEGMEMEESQNHTNFKLIGIIAGVVVVIVVAVVIIVLKKRKKKKEASLLADVDFDDDKDDEEGISL